MEVVETRFKEKEVDSIPAGAKVLSQDMRISVEEIENGFLVSKSTETKYEYDGRTDYSYHTKKFFNKTNPIEFKMDDKSLADKIDD